MEEINLFNLEEVDIDCNENSCVICYEPIFEKNIYTIKECNHDFHSNCLLDWFRTSKNTSCPYCRNNSCSSSSKIINNDILFKMKLNYAKNKNAPKLFVKLIEKYKKTKTKQKELLKIIKILKKEKIDENLSYKEYFIQRNLLYSKKQKYYKKERKVRREIYNIANAINLIPIKPIIIKTKKYNKNK